MKEAKLLAKVDAQLESYLEPPTLGNQFLDDSALRGYLDMYLNLMGLEEEVAIDIIHTLTSLGKNVAGYQNLAFEAEQHHPTLQVFDAFGKRINKVTTSHEWKLLREAAIKENIISDVYSGRFGVANRFVQVIKIYLFHASSAMWGGPMAVSDGLAAVLKKALNGKSGGDEMLKNCFDHLTSSDPAKAWSAGQWTTEKEGHIDPIQRIQTVANSTNDPKVFKLYGLKWYSMAPEGEVSIALARIVDQATGKADERLSAFLVSIRDSQGEIIKGIEITRLREKLGTKTIPAAELVLKGVEATLISERGEGLDMLFPLTDITRLHSSGGAVSYARRVHILCKDYALK